MLPAYCAMAAALVGVVAVVCMRETARRPLAGSPPSAQSEEEAAALVEAQAPVPSHVAQDGGGDGWGPACRAGPEQTHRWSRLGEAGSADVRQGVAARGRRTCMPDTYARRTMLTGAALLSAGGTSLLGAAPARAAGRVLAERRVDERLIELTLDSPGPGRSRPRGPAHPPPRVGATRTR